jgi:hypothetical protein
VPNDAAAAVAAETGRRDGGLQRRTNGVVLVILGDLLDNPRRVRLEDDEMADDFQQPLWFEYASD